jgi:hypothetical protein
MDDGKYDYLIQSFNLHLYGVKTFFNYAGIKIDLKSMDEKVFFNLAGAYNDYPNGSLRFLYKVGEGNFFRFSFSD